MEEILASIRRIISEDGDEPAESPPEEAGAPEAPVPEPETEPEPEPEPDPEPEAEEEVLELTDEVQEDGTVVNLQTGEMMDDEAEAEAETAEEVELDMVDPGEEPEPEPEPPQVAAPPPPQLGEKTDEDRLVSQMPASDTMISIAVLAQMIDEHRRATDMSIGSRPLEDVVKDVLRPMIREWLDDNLPSMVERLVSREIARISGDAESTAQKKRH